MWKVDAKLKSQFKMPARMLRAYQHSSDDLRDIFDATYQRLAETGLTLYPTNCPDIRARHPLNCIVFLTLRFQQFSGTTIEVRVDGCPDRLFREISSKREIRRHDPKGRALWASFPISTIRELEEMITSILAISLFENN